MLWRNTTALLLSQFSTTLPNAWKLVNHFSCMMVKSVLRWLKLLATLLFVFVSKTTASSWAVKVLTSLIPTLVAMLLLKKTWLISNLAHLVILTLSLWVSFRAPMTLKSFVKFSFLTVQLHKSLQRLKPRKLSKLMKNLRPSSRQQMPLWLLVVIWQLRLVTKLYQLFSVN